MGRTTNALAALRQLATQGVTMEAAWPAVQSIMARLVPHTNIFAGRVGPGGMIAGMQSTDDSPRDLMALYFSHYFNSREAEGMPTWRRFLSSGDSIGLFHGWGDAYYRSEVYNEAFKPAQIVSGIRLALGPVGARRGQLSLSRPDRKGFSHAEEALLRSAIPYLEHLWSAQDTAERFGHGSDCGYLLSDQSGRIHFMSAAVPILLQMAADIPYLGPSLSDRGYAWARPILRWLVANLNATGSALAGTPPAAKIRNRFGLFEIRAWHMESLTSGSDCAGIHICQHLPLAVRLLASPRAMQLSPRERDVLLAQANGLTREEAAKKLNLAPSSVASHMKSLYNKLDVNSVDGAIMAALQPMGMSPDSDASAGETLLPGRYPPGRALKLER